MDAERFDLLTKAFAVVRSRRRIVPLLVGLPAVGALVGLPVAGSAKAKGHHDQAGAEHKKKKKHKKKKCKPQPVSVTCNGKCGAVTNTCKQRVDCGACPCSGESCGLCQSCDDGVCQPNAVGSGCGGGKLCCGSPIACVDIKNDAANCGDCGQACPVDHICRKAACEICVCPDVAGCFATMQEAVDAALDDDVIRVCEGAFLGGTGAFSVPTGKTLSVIGAGSGLNPNSNTVLDGTTPPGRMAQIAVGAAVTLRDLRILNGNANGDGGGIHNAGTLALRDCALADNHASDAGGGIGNAAGATLTLTDCLVELNSAGSVGGGIANEGTLTINGATIISQNTATTGGGGLANIVSGIAEINNTSSVSHNDAQDGAGVFNTGTIVLNNASRIHDNSASRFGGGVFNDSASSAFVLNNVSTIEDNDAGTDGGGVFLQNGTLTLNNMSSIHDNDPDECVGAGCP